MRWLGLSCEVCVCMCSACCGCVERVGSLQVVPLGAGQDVGRSCILVSIGGKNVMLDCGMHMGYSDERRFPDFSWVYSSIPLLPSYPFPSLLRHGASKLLFCASSSETHSPTLHGPVGTPRSVPFFSGDVILNIRKCTVFSTQIHWWRCLVDGVSRLRYCVSFSSGSLWLTASYERSCWLRWTNLYDISNEGNCPCPVGLFPTEKFSNHHLIEE